MVLQYYPFPVRLSPWVAEAREIDPLRPVDATTTTTVTTATTVSKGNRKYEIIQDVDDEEIPEEEAFNSEDERTFGHFFQDKDDSNEQREKKILDSSDDEDVTSHQ